MIINRIYIGIPLELSSKIFWIARNYRLNELSFQIGGADIVIEYTNGTVFGYDWVKYPDRYVKKIFDKTFLNNSNLNELDAIKENVSRIFARKYDNKNYEVEKFDEIWNNKTSKKLPYSQLNDYILNTYKEYFDLFLVNIDFAKKYLSIHYPFDYSFLNSNWDCLEKGDAHYCVFLSDTDWIYPSNFGLSYNKNIRWNSKLRARFEYGFDNPFIGYVEGTGSLPVEYDEKDYLDSIIPLDKKLEIESRNNASISYWSSVVAPSLDFDDIENFVEPSILDLDIIFSNHEYLDFSEFKTIFEKNKLKALINDSIWDNTLSLIIDENFCEKIFDEIIKAHNI